jgi:hypothetical protein
MEDDAAPHRRERFSDTERKKLARDIVDELWVRIRVEVGGSVIKKVVWALILIALAVGAIKFPDLLK